MENLDLYQILDASEIELYDFSMPENKSASAMAIDGHCYVALDTLAIETSAEERVHLAHELGHCMSGSFYNIYAPGDVREKHECRANKWGIKKLLPKDELDAAIKDNALRNEWEVAEYFNVTVDFVLKALEYYGSAS